MIMRLRALSDAGICATESSNAGHFAGSDAGDLGYDGVVTSGDTELGLEVLVSLRGSGGLRDYIPGGRNQPAPQAGGKEQGNVDKAIEHPQHHRGAVPVAPADSDLLGYSP